MPTSRIVLVLVDGIGDVSLPDFGNKSTLEVANTPNFDAIAAAGINGLMDPVEPGYACGSDTAHLSLFGYDPRIYYNGRGAFESMGAGLSMFPGDIAFKSNFAVVDDESGIVVNRRADRKFENEGPILCEFLDGLIIPGFPNYSVSIRYATEHRCGVVVRGPDLSSRISGTDPLKDGRPLISCHALEDSGSARFTADLINALSDEIRRLLSSHPINLERISVGKKPANVVLLRGCGQLIYAPSFEERHGLNAAMIAPTKIIAGIGQSLGIRVIEVEGATGDYRTSLTAKAVAMAKALSTPSHSSPKGEKESISNLSPKPVDFGFLHIKAVDDAGHDKAENLKIRLLEAADAMVGQLARLLWNAETDDLARYCLAVTGDHSTPVLYGDHSFEPVPFVICHLADYVKIRGEDVVMAASLDHFPLPMSNDIIVGSHDGDGGVASVQTECNVFTGDCVTKFNEIIAVRGCLGRFSGCEMMKVIKAFASS